MRPQKTIGVIGGSGLYDMQGLTAVEEVTVTTPFGTPSDSYVVGQLGDARLIFLPRHGRGHRFLPHEINYRANIHGLKQLGAEYILSISAVGSLREEIHPGHIVLPDQFIDRTRGRASTFFGDGVVAHIQFGDPVCRVLHDTLRVAAQSVCATACATGGPVGPVVHSRGTYVVMEGPAFSTRAESHMYRSFGADVVGMTNLPEAKLAREAEICYATVALSTDYDCWRQGEEDVSVEAVMAIVHQNVALAQDIVRDAARLIIDLPARTCPCATAVRHAVMTAPERVTPQARERMSLILKSWASWEPLKTTP